jgi:P pilus assembly chaperone PapD
MVIFFLMIGPLWSSLISIDDNLPGVRQVKQLTIIFVDEIYSVVNFRNFCALVFVGLASACFIPGTPVIAQTTPASSVALAPVTGVTVGAANLNITPRRVIFEGSKRTEAVYVFNQGAATAAVDVALVDNIMLPTGEIVPVTRAAEKGTASIAPLGRLKSARDLIIATPGRLTLAPGTGKTIRLRAGLPSGVDQTSEYRTHLTITTLPPASSGVTADAAASSRGELSISINTVFGISIPLIVRNGQTEATAAYGGFALEHDIRPATDTEPARPLAILVAPLKRNGSASVYGNVEVRSGNAKNGELIGLTRGIAVYPELDQRELRIPLAREPRRGEDLSVIFIADDGKLGGELARGSFSAP